MLDICISSHTFYNRVKYRKVVEDRIRRNYSTIRLDFRLKSIKLNEKIDDKMYTSWKLIAKDEANVNYDSTLKTIINIEQYSNISYES